MTNLSDILRERLVLPIATETINRFTHEFFDDAVLNAFKVVEERLRAITGASDANAMGLITQAFHPSTGLLTDTRLLPSEKEGIHALFRGAFMSFRNPAAHNFTRMTEEEAFEVILLTNRLYKIIENSYRVRSNIHQVRPNASYIIYSSVNQENNHLELDVDNDGISESLIIKQEDTYRVVEIQKPGTDLVLGRVPMHGEQLEMAFMADIDNDGAKELACFYSFTAGSTIIFYRLDQGQASVLFGTDPRTGRDVDIDFYDAQIIDIDGDGRLEIVSEPWDRIPDDLWPRDINRDEEVHDWGRVRYVYRWNSNRRVFDLLHRELLYIGGR